MRRIKLVLAVAVAMAVMMVTSVTPAMAQTTFSGGTVFTNGGGTVFTNGTGFNSGLGFNGFGTSIPIIGNGFII
jgi:hypothetical protein